MPEEESPPKRSFRFKAKEFERLNPLPPSTSPRSSSTDALLPTVAATIQPAVPPKDLDRDVHTLLQLNRTRLEAISPMPAQSSRWKRSLRARRYAAALLLVDTPLVLLAWHSGPTDPLIFVFAISALALFTSWLTWQVWFLRS